MTDALARHYRVKELAALWGFCDNTIINLFADEPGVLRLERMGSGRKYVSLSIPESVALRVHERLGHQSFQPELSGVTPVRVVCLRDFNAGMSQKARHVVKLKAA